MEALKNLDVWKRACRLSVDLYKVTNNCTEYSFKDQVAVQLYPFHQILLKVMRGIL